MRPTANGFRVDRVAVSGCPIYQIAHWKEGKKDSAGVLSSISRAMDATVMFWLLQ